MRIRLLAALFCGLIFTPIFGQNRKCGTPELSAARLLRDPSLAAKRAAAEAHLQTLIRNNATQTDQPEAIVTIPVVVHVVYKTTTQNISDAQIQSQIDVLNKDFRKLNTDITSVPTVWQPLAADVQVQFCLAKRTPTGTATTGITRTATTRTLFEDNAAGTLFSDDVKFTADGGKDGWDPYKYLNIWVCRLDGSTFGYTYLPSDLADYPEFDGVVIDYHAFGTTGTAGTGTGFSGVSNKGRTATHEIGHWLNLEHIWGDGDGSACLSDLVADTPPADVENYGCPTFPRKVGAFCTTDPNGQMFMNYMDYCNDACLYMFTNGQSDRMNATLNGIRLSIKTSNGCNAPVPVELISFSGKTDGKRNVLNWLTASELNNDFFHIERSFDGKRFVEIGQIRGHGTTAERHEYAFLDAASSASVVYYRLRQVDLDGSFTYSNVVSIQNGGRSLVKIFPNPVGTEGLIVQIDGDGEKKIDLTDITGRAILSQKISSHEAILETAHLSDGLYFCIIRNATRIVDVQKVIVQK